jgi:radical SAM protein with 4Fe4S-binding SPASM domain
MTVCRSSIPPMGKEDLRRIREAFLRQRVPASGSLELTRRCNLRCVHCYAGPAVSGAPPEQDIDWWRAILGEMAEAGCLSLLMTGGEPLLRPDFPAVYQRAKELGMLVTVFTNATLIRPGIVDLFREWPPEEVEITILGASAEIHDRLAGMTGAFDRFRAGWRALRDAGIRTALKTVIMKPNRQELAAMERLARDEGVSFRIDPILFPRFDGDRTPLELRLAPDEAAAADFSDPERRERWHAAMGELSALVLPETGQLYLCGAGQTSFHIDPAGILTPCLMLRQPAFALAGGSFADGWAALSSLAELEAPADYLCRGCRFTPICGVCPAHSLLENGALDRPPNFCCELSQERCILLSVQESGGIYARKAE